MVPPSLEQKEYPRRHLGHVKNGLMKVWLSPQVVAGEAPPWVKATRRVSGDTHGP